MAEIEYRKIAYPRDAQVWEDEPLLLAGDQDLLSEYACENYSRQQDNFPHASLSRRTGLLYLELDYVDEGKYGMHDPFRVAGYPEDECHSLQETLDFIARYEQEHPGWVELYATTQERLASFWNRYPKGMITFG